MQIWVDADACPNVIKEMLYRAADRRQVLVTLVANQFLRVPASPFIKTKRVAAGFNVADDKIVACIDAGDLVITADIPLAAEAIGKGAQALNPRGDLYSEETIAERLSMRNFMDELRSGGIDAGGPAPMTPRHKQNFANQLDRILAANGKP
ncbi:YaiI/YqxD family protein [Thermodesulfobacteriota bacterium]